MSPGPRNLNLAGGSKTILALPAGRGGCHNGTDNGTGGCARLLRPQHELWSLSKPSYL